MTITPELKDKVLTLLTKENITEGTYSVHDLADEFGTTWQTIEMILRELSDHDYIFLSIKAGGFAFYRNNASIYSFASEGGFGM